MIKVWIQQEDITFINIYALNIREPKYINQINRPGGRNRQQYNNSRGFQYPSLTMDRSSRQKIHKDTLELNYTLDQMNVTDNSI